MEFVEILSALGFLARSAARILFIPRYCLDSFASLRHWHQNKYALQRFGAGFYWRIWLLFDIKELEETEKLINEGHDDELLKLRETQLESVRLVALVGALLASVALQALNLPFITSTHFLVRAQFTITLMLSILATFFTCIQQRELGVVRSAPALRTWLSNGVRYQDRHGQWVFQSSITAHTLLEAPYEFLSVSIANFVGGMAAYLGSAWVNDVKLSPDGGNFGDGVVILYFAVATTFAFALFPLLLGCKSKEIKAAENILKGLDRPWHMVQVRGVNSDANHDSN